MPVQWLGEHLDIDSTDEDSLEMDCFTQLPLVAFVLEGDMYACNYTLGLSAILRQSDTTCLWLVRWLFFGIILQYAIFLVLHCSDVYKKTETIQVESFQDMLDNFFKPLFEVTSNPASLPDLASFLEHVRQ